MAQSVHNGGLALWRSCRPREEAARVFGFHPQCYQARWFVFGLMRLQGGRPKPPREAVERIEAVDAGMVRRMMVVMVSRGGGHAHETLQITVGVWIWSHTR